MARFLIGGCGMVLTLCDRCLQPFIDDPNYTVRIVRKCTPIRDRDAHECECDICTKRGHDYDIDKIKK